MEKLVSQEFNFKTLNASILTYVKIHHIKLYQKVKNTTKALKLWIYTHGHHTHSSMPNMWRITCHVTNISL